MAGTDYLDFGVSETYTPVYGSSFSGSLGNFPNGGTPIRTLSFSGTNSGKPYDSNSVNDFRFCIRAEEVEANNEIATANLTGTPVCIRGSLSAGDSDYFAIVNDTENSQTFTFALFRPIGGVNTDTILSLYDLSGSLITEDDDLGEVNYSMISRALDVDSAYYVRINDFSSLTNGDYELIIYGSQNVTTNPPQTALGGQVDVTIR